MPDSDDFFSLNLPPVALLHWLARGNLSQHLKQALRLWIWLRKLYDPAVSGLSLPGQFTYADCRDAFFAVDHPTTDQKPTEHNPNCACCKTVAAWLFAPQLDMLQSDWETYQTQNSTDIRELQHQLERELAEYGGLPHQFDSFLHQTRLFAVTRRTLASDLQRLSELGWLTMVESTYRRVEAWPKPPYAKNTALTGNQLAFLVQPDLAAIADNLSQEVEGERRFFVHVDYVVPQDRHDRVEDWHAQLRDLWRQPLVPPVQLYFWSAAALKPYEVVVYPVCIYYYRRGPYLCGFGEIAEQPDSMDWRNYRLDRIQSLRPLTWEDDNVPLSLKQRHQERTLPSADEIELRMSEAWGFDYYQPPQQLLLRFDQVWDQRYIHNSLRHGTFEQVSYWQARQLIQQTLSGEQQRQLLAVMAERSDQDAYYQAIYRQNDPNVKQRLRSWRPHIEVLLPWSLRQSFGQEVAEEIRAYWDVIDKHALDGNEAL